MTPARFRWGLLFILAGTLMLLAEADVINLDFVLELAYLFPFLLIAIGIEKIFSKTRFKIMSYVSSVLLVAGALWVAFDTSSSSSNQSFFESGTIEYEAEDEPVDHLEVELELDNANLEVRSASDALIRASFGEWSLKPRSEMAITDGIAEISLRARSLKRKFGDGTVGIETGTDDEWRVRFAKDTPLSLKCSGSYNDVHLNLAANRVKDINLDLDDADIYVKLGCLESKVNLTLAGDDSKMRLRIPQEAGLQISGIDLGVYLEEIGMILKDSVWVTEGFDETECQILATAGDNFRSFSIDFY